MNKSQMKLNDAERIVYEIPLRKYNHYLLLLALSMAYKMFCSYRSYFVHTLVYVVKSALFYGIHIVIKWNYTP